MALALLVRGVSHRGRVRARNEDTWGVVPERGAVVVADGMGGPPGGDEASRLAVEAFCRHLEESPDEPDSPEIRGDAMRSAVAAAHDAVRARAEVVPALDGMGTTLTAAALTPPDGVIVVHVGDSRCYRLRDGELERLTDDHTWVAREVAAGRLDADVARVHPRSHVLTRAVGSDRRPDPDVTLHGARPGDLLLLCTDGLTNMLDDAELHRVLTRAPPVAEPGVPPDEARLRLRRATRRLLEAALSAGGVDNVTAVLAAIR